VHFSNYFHGSDSDKPKIWYPDFFLPEFALHLEYFGINGNSDYDKRSRHKESVYKANGLDVISVYPGHFENDWQGYIAGDIKDVLDRRGHTPVFSFYYPLVLYL